MGGAISKMWQPMRRVKSKWSKLVDFYFPISKKERLIEDYLRPDRAISR